MPSPGLFRTPWGPFWPPAADWPLAHSGWSVVQAAIASPVFYDTGEVLYHGQRLGRIIGLELFRAAYSAWPLHYTHACACGSPHWRPMHGQPYAHAYEATQLHARRCDWAPPDGSLVALSRPAWSTYRMHMRACMYHVAAMLASRPTGSRCGQCMGKNKGTCIRGDAIGPRPMGVW